MAALHSTTQILPRVEIGTEAISLQNRGPILFGTCIAFMVITVIVMIARIYCRAILLKNMGSDDWCMIAATVSAVGLVVCSCLSVSKGYGKHQWVLPWQDSVLILKLSYTGQPFYFIALGFCKASLILFIIRMRPSRRMVIICWCIFCFCAAFSFAAFISTSLQCLPVYYPWSQLNPNLTGKVKHHCVNQLALQIALPSINIFTDFVVWLLPIKMIWKVQLPQRQKWGLIAVFSLGGLGVLSGILRLWSIREAILSVDGSWGYLDFTLWSNIEVLTSIIFGSGPAVKPFFSRYIPGLLGSSSLRSYTRSGTRFPSASHDRTKSRTSRSNAYALRPISGGDGVSRTEHSSTEEFRMGGIMTRVEAPGRGDGDSGEYHGVLGGIVKSTDVHVLVEERV